MRVSINMAMSLDGKIATKKRGPVKLGSAYDSRRMSQIRAQHDVVINGAATFKAYPYPLSAKGHRRQPISAIVSSRLKIPRGTPWEKARGTERWAFCGKSAARKTILSLREAGVTVVQTRGARPAPKEILTAFRRAGLKKVLLEGGGEFNASFLEQDLVDEIFLTAVPIVIGGAESPTWFEGKGFEGKGSEKGKFRRFRLKECRRVKGELYLRYSR